MNRIKKNLVFTLAIATIAISVFSCADNSLTPENEISYFDTFDKWVKKNYPNIPKVDGKDGLYMKITQNGSGSTPTDSCYVTIEYSSQLPNGNYIANTDPIVARQLNTFSHFTRYSAPFTFRLTNWGSYYGLTQAHYDALKLMKAGDEVEMVVAPNYGYYFSLENMYEGFNGNVTTSSSTASYIKMKLVSYILDAESEAKRAVRGYIDETWNNLEEGLYMKKDPAYINNNEADSVRSDSTLKLNYVGYFTDKFVFDTNIEKVADENNIYVTTTGKYTPLSFHYNKSDSTNYGGMIKAMKPVIAKMRLGEKATFICYPSLAYGASGKYNTSGTLIYTHTPLLFDIEIIKPEED